MYVYLEVKKVIRNILKSRTDSIDGLWVEKIYHLQHEDTSVYLVSDLDACKTILSSGCFTPENMGLHIDKLLKRLNIESTGLKRFLEHSPLISTGDDHFNKRIEFSRVIEEIFKVVPASEAEVFAHFDAAKFSGPVSSSTLARRYIDRVLSEIFKRVLGVDSLYEKIATHSRGLFDVFPDPRKIVPLTSAIDDFIASYPHTDEGIPEIIRKNPYIILGLVIMGREPLVGLMTSYINGTLRKDDPRSATPTRISPVNFIVRRCVADITILARQLKRDDVVYLMLSGANQAASHSYRGLSFGHGAHFCIGYRLAKMLFENFKSKFDLQRFTLVPAKPQNEAFLMFETSHE
jgi:hypothetical protein